MKKEIIVGLTIVAISIVTGYFALGFHNMSDTQDNLNDATKNANLESCESIRENVCLTSNSITESDYPDSCFENGENLLENPYECPS